ncbi:MAG: VanZ family protein [Candidatus Omnitrophota bacterium]
MTITKPTLSLSIYIVISSLFMQQLWQILEGILGKNLLNILLVALSFASTIVVLRIKIKNGQPARKMILILAVCLVTVVFAWRQPYLQERAHVLEFSLLGWLARRDLDKKETASQKKHLLSLVFVAGTGVLEEAFQKLLPWRVFDIRDIVTDILSGLLGIILYAA